MIKFQFTKIESNLLPNLLIIGAAKAGTTSLHKYLNEHPQIFMTEKKEPRFFLVWDNPEQVAINEKENHSVFNQYNTIEKYQELFEDGQGFVIRGESSPQYLTYMHCAAKIKKLIPDVKIIAVLRNPIDRAYSHYTMYRGWKMENKSFADAIDEEIITGRLNYILDMRYLHLGKYVEQLKPYLHLFSPHQLRIYLYDDFMSDSYNFLKSIFQFLGVDESIVSSNQPRLNISHLKTYENFPAIDKVFYKAQRGFKKFNIPFFEGLIRKHRFYKPPFGKETREKLIEYYSGEISELEKLLKNDLSAWKK